MKFDYKELIDEVRSKNFWPRLFIMIFGVFLLATSYNIFLLPNDLVTGGTSGLAIIFHHIFKIDPALFIFLVEIVLLVLSFTLLGTKKTGMTIIGSLLYPLFISITAELCEIISTKIILDSNMLVALISGLLVGVGSGLVYKMGYSTGGADIIMQIMNKYLKMSTGTAAFILNITVIVLGVFIFGLNKAIYGTIIVIINSILVDKIMLGISDSKIFYIKTNKEEQVKHFIKTMNTGYTIIKAEGGYTGKSSDLIMCVINNKDYYMVKNVIQKIDPKAFFIISDCYEVYGGHRKEISPFL